MERGETCRRRHKEAIEVDEPPGHGLLSADLLGGDVIARRSFFASELSGVHKVGKAADR